MVRWVSERYTCKVNNVGASTIEAWRARLLRRSRDLIGHFQAVGAGEATATATAIPDGADGAARTDAAGGSRSWGPGFSAVAAAPVPPSVEILGLLQVRESN